MPIIRNPFRKQDENARPPLKDEDWTNSDAVRAIDTLEKIPIEYQMSEVNDSGVFMPPSPEEKRSFWTTSSRSTTSSSIHRCAFDENEQFSISRESFDSYRRSFDISARSPIIQPEGRPRRSLDSRTFSPLPRSSSSYTRPLQVPQTQEEDRFEDVNIDDPKPPTSKKRGLFSRMVDTGEQTNASGQSAPIQEKSSGWHAFGRKRGQSGQGSELGSMKHLDESRTAPTVQQVPQAEIKPLTQSLSDKPVVTATVKSLPSADSTRPAMTKGFESVPIH